jgi:translation initiation factor 4G
VKLKEAENAWKPTVKAKDESVDEVEVLAKRVRSILNKLCPQKFDTLVAQFMELPIDSMEKMTKAMELVFEKALDEPAFAVAYARMCKTLSLRKIHEEGKEVNFRTLLITRCQREFQKDYMADLDRTAYVEKLSKATTEEEKKEINMEFSAQETKLRRRSLGNIKFIGELYRIQMLNGRIMHEIIQKLLRETDEESLECLCRLITTVGKILDEETQKLLASPRPPAGYNSLDLYFTSVK